MWGGGVECGPLLPLTPGHLEAVGQNSPSDHRPAGTAGFVRICDELHQLARVTLPLRVVRCHLQSKHEPRAARGSHYSCQSCGQLFAQSMAESVERSACSLITSGHWDGG